MITDKLSNVNLYNNIPDIVKDFILNISPDIGLGRITLSDSVYVNVESYITKNICDAKFESHNKYIDIQILSDGVEKIAYAHRSFLTESTPYNSEKDITFYSDKVQGYEDICLNGTNFVMLFPHEAHAPQICADNQSKVKKIVIKIRV